MAHSLPVTPFFGVGKFMAANFTAFLVLSCKLAGFIVCLCAVSGVSLGGGRDHSLSLGSGTVLNDHTRVNIIFVPNVAIFQFFLHLFLLNVMEIVD